MNAYDTIDLGTVDSFNLTLEALPEDVPLLDTFDFTDNPESEQELIDKVESGEWVYFCAKVTASREGIELGIDYLGGCVYDSLQQFADTPGYIDDMKSQAITEAWETLYKLTGVK